jgi:hypothetical protein
VSKSVEEDSSGEMDDNWDSPSATGLGKSLEAEVKIMRLRVMLACTLA